MHAVGESYDAGLIPKILGLECFAGLMVLLIALWIPSATRLLQGEIPLVKPCVTAIEELSSCQFCAHRHAFSRVKPLPEH